MMCDGEDPVEGEKTFDLDIDPGFADIPETRVTARQSCKSNRSPSPSRPEVSVFNQSTERSRKLIRHHPK